MMAPRTIAVLAITLPWAMAAQQNPPRDINGSTLPMMVIEMRPGDTALVREQPSREGRLSRWLDLDLASVGTRFRHVESLMGVTIASNQQHQFAIKGGLRLDSAGRLTVRAGLFSGDTFSGGWNNTGPGTGLAQSRVFLKRLYLDATPIRGIDVQVGGVEFARGESTEITSYDYDGYLVGERLAIRRADRLFVDEVTVTYGFVGDLRQPSVFPRLLRLGRANYRQFEVAKQAGKRVRISGDYTSESGIDTLRQAVTFNVPELRAVSLFHFEQYERLGAASGYGFSGYLEKKLGRRISLGPGYARLDRPGLYSDRFNVGKRIFWNGHLALGAEWSLMALATCAVDTPISSAPRRRFDLVLSYDLLHRLRAARLL
jgi:hypothetical protein